MIYDREKLQELIPLYASGQLSESERHAVERSLEKNPDLRQELADDLELKEAYRQIESEVRLDPEKLFSRIEARIQPKEKPAKVPARRQPQVNRPGFSIRDLFFSPRLAWGIVAIQFLIIFALFPAVDQKPAFTTLSSSPEAVAGGVNLHIVFREETTEAAMRSLILAAHGEIVSGPSATGLYVVRVENDGALQEVLSTLQNSPVIRFAAKAD
ncbi:MAG: hypothetical protein C0616_11330 [Desulfuromonas sp.]|nr:MAG: hypothetical protein C0616_11330 [Desulfuromonas sp.]